MTEVIAMPRRTDLKIAANLVLPLEVVTQKLGWIGTTGSGKTYGASKLAELLWDAHAQFVVLDPVGVWYGLRLAKDGKRPSDITIPIFGGLHGDVPLESTAGALMADLIVDRTISAILDVSQFESDAQKARFAADFAERFFFRKKAAPTAVHLFIEECQEFVPEHQQRGEERMLHAFTRLQKIGRNFGIGTSYITQRPQEVAKKALNLAQTLFVFRTTGAHERAAIERWIKDKAIEGQDIAGELPKLKTGSPHVWSPEWLQLSSVVNILEKRTFNASATPEVGAAAVTRQLAPIDLEKIRTEMAATIEKAKADDPRELRKRIVDLEREVVQAVRSRPTPTAATLIEHVDRPVLTDKDRELLATQRTYLEQMAGKLGVAEEEIIGKALDRMAQAASHIVVDAKAEIERRRAEFLRTIEQASYRKVFDKITAATPVQPQRHTLTTTAGKDLGGGTRPAARVSRPASQGTPGSGEGLSRAAERKILAALSQYPEGRSVRQVAILTVYAKNGGGFRNALGALRKLGYIDGTAERLVITDAGRQAIGDVEPLPTGRALLERWLQQLDRKAEREILSVLAAAYPEALTAEEIASRTETQYEAAGGGFRNALGKLRTLELIEGRGTLRASEDLFG